MVSSLGELLSLGLESATESNPARGAVRRSSGQDVPRLLWNWKVQYAVRKSTPLDPVQRQLNTVYIVTSNFCQPL
jgi:hypothetical protein